MVLDILIMCYLIEASSYILDMREKSRVSGTILPHPMSMLLIAD